MGLGMGTGTWSTWAPVKRTYFGSTVEDLAVDLSLCLNNLGLGLDVLGAGSVADGLVMSAQDLASKVTAAAYEGGGG